MNNNRFQYWIFFGFIFTIIPIVVTLIIIKGSTEGGITWSNAFKEAIAKGELFLVCISLLGANIGDLIKEECKNTNSRNMFIGITIVLFFIAVSLFAAINTNSKFDKELSFNSSLLSLVCSFIICLISSFIPRK